MTTIHLSLNTRERLGAGALTKKFDDAMQFAFERHRFHFRKGSRVPYLSHLMSVSSLALEHGASEDQAIAALLHDAVEDAAEGQGPEVLQAIGQQFGESVRQMVEACSDTVNDDERGKPCWRDRKLAYVVGLRNAEAKSDEALVVTAADKIHNAGSITRDLRTYGPQFWSTFNAPSLDLLWYYTAVEAAVADRLGGHTIVDALHRAVDELIVASAFDRVTLPDVPSICRCPRHLPQANEVPAASATHR
ncbi:MULTISPECIES: HD domain-containing protein [unclassified Modestobacter]|uniref:HD domain-containing protein n=1 Tax=unclassified Modestobacter TaxID=2643866 RepID=UPI0022AADC72|nr:MULTISPECIES: HD domain-containing protein [unclassified Modestobacter]MCZ2826078.1 HD domain-containing protein [Modestobacter sp. VKM Ac-2981]MCZ2852857.1 HD domain-containing protein [Modestobacter sp. VKM Ac-2982]